MADKSFGVRELNLTNTSGTPTVSSPNQLNLSAHTVAISTSVTVGQNLTVSANAGISSLNVTGIGTVLNLNVLGVGTITSPSDANAHSRWKVTNQSASAYRFTGPGQDGSENNPNVYLVRGQRYIFDVNASGHPFQLRVANGGAAYSDGVTNNGAQSGQVIFNVQHDAPAQLYYQCTNHGSMVGNIYIVGGPQVISGVLTATSFSGSGANLTNLPAQATIANNADNRVITGGSGVNLNGEANLTYDGTNLQLLTDANSEGIKAISNGNSYPIFELDSDRSSAGNTIGKLVSKWNNTEVASIQFVSGDDTSNKDNASIYLNTRSGGSGNVLRLRITQDGQLGTTEIVRSAYGGLDLCSQGATNFGTLTLGAGGGQNGQSRSSNQENQFRIMMPTYANPSNMTTVMYGASSSGGHELNYGGGTGWAYATNTHKFFTTANATTATGTERLRIASNGQVCVGNGHVGGGGQLIIRGVGVNNYAVLDNQYVGTPSSGTTLSQIRFTANTTGSSVIGGARIQAAADAAWSASGDAPTRLQFYTAPNGSASQQERMRIDHNGIITKPYQPAFLAHNNGSYASSGTINNGSVIDFFRSTKFNRGNHYDASNGYFVAPVAGIYYFNAVLSVRSSNVGVQIGYTVNSTSASGLYYGGTDVLVFEASINGLNAGHPNGAMLMSLSAGDIVRLFNRSAAFTCGRHHSWWLGYLIG